MLVHIFEGKKPAYGFTNDNTGAKLPPEYGPWRYFKSKIINRGSNMIGADPDQVLDGITTNGYHIGGAVVRVGTP